MSNQDYSYVVALSFAGEDRKYAKELAQVLTANSINVFYDEYEEATLWGKNLYTHLSEVYQKQARFCVMFLSQHYAQKLWTNHEREAAQARAFQENKEYILPIRLDNTEIPGILPTIGYLKWSNADSIANAIIKKLKQETPNQRQLDSVNKIANSHLTKSPSSDQTEATVTATSASLAESQIKLTKQQKILIMTAIPYGLRLDKEIREIEEAIRRATNRNLFEIHTRTAVRPQDIRRAIAEEQPQIVHFCGHGLEDGSLLLEDERGNNKPVSPGALASLFKLHVDYVKCVLLNACYSEKPAVAISQYIDYVIGMNNPIQDSAAIEFAKGFYDGLGYKNLGNQDVFLRAFDEAMVAIEMENLSQGEIPVLKKKF